MHVSHLSKALLAMGPSPAPGQQPSFWVQVLPLLLMGVVFYFLLIAPQRRRQKQLQEMLASLKSGDAIVTSGGIHGKVVGVTDQIVQVRIADGVRIDVSRSAIAAKLPD